MSLARQALAEARALLAAVPTRADLPVAPVSAPAAGARAPSRGGSSDLSGEGPLLSAARALRAGAVSAEQLLDQARAAIAARNPELHAVVETLGDDADRAARAADAEARAGRWRSVLQGIPVTVKDVIHVRGAATRAGSAGFLARPERDAAAVARMRSAGAVVVAKVSTHELALGVTTPQCGHPSDALRIPGGSSGGSAIAVATGMGLASIGTDTRASIRVPASLCGVVGFKATHGLVPTEGVVTLSWTMDHVGPLASSVADAARVAEVLVGDRSLLVPQRQPSPAIRLAVPAAALSGAQADVAAVTEKSIKSLEAAGLDLVDVDRPSDVDFELASAAGMVISRCEALAFHRSVGTRLDRLSSETAEQLFAAEEIRAEEYVHALRIRSQLADELRRALEGKAHAFALPTTLVTAPLRIEAEAYLTLLARNVIPWSMLGWPALSVPCGQDSSGLPVGLQITAPPYQDELVLRLGLMIEQA